jgi:type III pantothenate kinase
MNLVIDIGNTFTKAALFNKNEIIEKRVFDDKGFDQLMYFIQSTSGIDFAILSAVKNYRESLKNYLRDKFNFIELNENTPLPVNDSYKTPKTLGKDRLAAAIGGKLYYSEKDVLVVSAGTCITYDFITRNNDYMGGGISPGLHMRLKSLNIFTANLPLVELSQSFDKLIGQTTEESILSGVINGVVSEIEGICKLYKQKYPNFKYILTGGDYIFLEKRLKNSIFAVPDLVLTGLNIILDYNVKKDNNI